MRRPRAEAARQEQKAQDARADNDSDGDGGEATREDEAERRLPELNDGQALNKVRVDSQQKFTQPPPRFNEASLVKTLEENGIGRPSTYASIINTIQERDYVKKIKARLVPTEIGMVVTDLLVKNFPYIFKVEYTAGLENELDAVEEGTEKWTDLLNGFYDHLEDELKVASEDDGRRQGDGAGDGRDLREVRSSAVFEVGQVRELLLVRELHE